MFTPTNQDHNDSIENLVTVVADQIDRQFEMPLDALAQRVPPAGDAVWMDA